MSCEGGSRLGHPGGASILRMDLANWQTYPSVMVALGMSGDGGGTEAGDGLQCWRITVLG